jgi:hypothetical protein
MTQKPIIETCINDSNSLCMIYAKGHFDTDAFIGAVKDWEAWDHPRDGELYPVDSMQIQRGHMRCVPVPPDLRGDLPFSYTLQECQPGRGAFVVTYIEFE